MEILFYAFIDKTSLSVHEWKCFSLSGVSFQCCRWHVNPVWHIRCRTSKKKHDLKKKKLKHDLKRKIFKTWFGKNRFKWIPLLTNELFVSFIQKLSVDVVSVLFALKLIFLNTWHISFSFWAKHFYVGDVTGYKH